MVTHDDDNGTLLHNDLVLLVIEKLRDFCVLSCFSMLHVHALEFFTCIQFV